MLVGGTALAGYYAGHRRSDDLDLFAQSSDSTRAAVLAVESLRSRGVRIDVLQRSQQFYSASCHWRGHGFTAQVVLVANLFDVGDAFEAADGVCVASLGTLMKTKAATLVSRCPEKDLYDLIWLFGEFPDLGPGDLITLGTQIDGGMGAESFLISLAGTVLDVASCGFAPPRPAAEVLAEIRSFEARLMQAFEKVARAEPTPAIGELIRKLKG